MMMNRLFAAIPALALALPVSAGAMPLADYPTIDQARTVYAQCLSVGAARASRTEIRDRDAFAAAKSDCAEHRDAIVASAKGNADIVAALDAVEAEKSTSFAARTKTIRAMRVAIRTH
jgi:hypothetical protein